VLPNLVQRTMRKEFIFWDSVLIITVTPYNSIITSTLGSIGTMKVNGDQLGFRHLLNQACRLLSLECVLLICDCSAYFGAVAYISRLEYVSASDSSFLVYCECFYHRWILGGVVKFVLECVRVSFIITYCWEVIFEF
jgi:hypothetical protein